MTDRDFALHLMYHEPHVLGHLLGYTKLTPLHGAWMHEMLWGTDDMTLQAHRGSYKTTCLCLVLATMCVTMPDKTILFIRKTDDDVVEVIRQVRMILLNEKFAQLTADIYGTSAPVQIVRDTMTAITTDCYSAPRGAVQLLGVGTGGSLTGKHADIIITDDIINLQDRVSRAERERIKGIYRELQNIRNPGGRIINTGTPWHPEDAFSIMPPAKRYDFRATGLLTPEQIDRLRRSMTPSLFAANYELQHIAAENALFSTPPTFTDDADWLRDGIAHIDAAYGGEDFTALTCAKREGDTLYMHGRLWRAHVDTCMDAILADCDRLLCAPLYCETNGDKGYLARELRSRGAAVRAYSEHQNKYNKISTFLRKWWGNIVFLEGTDPAYINQIMDYNEQADHDDAPDSAACVCRILDRRE